MVALPLVKVDRPAAGNSGNSGGSGARALQQTVAGDLVFVPVIAAADRRIQ